MRMPIFFPLHTMLMLPSLTAKLNLGDRNMNKVLPMLSIAVTWSVLVPLLQEKVFTPGTDMVVKKQAKLKM